ncbi:MAG TPA: MFS transporter [Flavisolibacter sp.]|nr:MFS transporter [Flavisolibacter sp.]
MQDATISLNKLRKAYRLAVGCLFFMQGLCFASWASRIPSIQQKLGVSEMSLGLILLALPAGSMIGLPFSGWLVTRFGSKRVAANALLVYSLLLLAVGFSPTIWMLVAGLVLFGMAGNISNIAINTQAVGVEARYGRNIMASFHGLWSLAGFAAAGIGSFMTGRNIVPFNHFLIITALLLAGIAACFQYLLPEEQGKATTGAKLFGKPDKQLLGLGLIAFCCMLCEGAMFDWSGIYFKKVVEAPPAMIGAGYTAFMCTMAAGRFFADRVTSHLGFKKTVRISSVLIASGLGLSVVLPHLYTAIAGFLLVGFGVSSVVPLVYSEAGKSKIFAPGPALAAVSSIGFLGFLIGPPLIGIIAGLFSLRLSFLFIAIIGILIFIIAGSPAKSGAAGGRPDKTDSTLMR